MHEERNENPVDLIEQYVVAWRWEGTRPPIELYGDVVERARLLKSPYPFPVSVDEALVMHDRFGLRPVRGQWPALTRRLRT